MLIKIIDAPTVCGGRALALCDDDGTILPGQEAVEVQAECGGVARITVTFAIDGDSIRFAD